MINIFPRCFLLAAILLIPVISICQTQKLDSLQRVLSNLPTSGNSFANDTARVIILCELGRGKDENGLFVGNYQQCMAWLDEAEKISRRHKWTKGLMLSNLYAGVWNGWKGYSLQGLQKKQKALYYAELGKNPYWLGVAYRHLGDQHYMLGNYGSAVSYLTQALEPTKKTNLTTYLLVNQNLGTAYYGKKDYKNALLYLEKAYLLCTQAKNQQLLKYVILNWAEVCLAVGQIHKLDQLLTQYASVDFTDHAWDVHYYALSAQRYLLQNAPRQALKELKSGLPYLHLASYQHSQELFLQLSRAYEKLGEPTLSLYYFKQYSTLWEKDIKLFQQKQTEYLKYEYENQKQQDAIKLLNQDIKQQRLTKNTLFGGVVLALSFVVFLFWSNRALGRKNRVIENQRNELLLLKNRLSDSNLQLVRFNEELEQKVIERAKDLVEANEELIRKNLEIRDAFVNGKTIERKRVASELHDNLGSTISGLIWQLQSIMPENFLPKEYEIYNGLIQQMRNAYTEIRYISHHLYPIELEKGLDTALKRLLSDLNNNRQIHFELKGTYPKDFLSKEQETELYSICLELINNTIKHSESTECLLNFTSSEHSIEMIFIDNGKGFDPLDSKKRGRGLENVRDRVESLNGSFKIDSGEGQGVTIRIEFHLT